ncbi:MAG: hypothetical protein WDN69_03400 [Aliidongia sp.]
MLNILAARTADQLNSSMVETLQNAAGPGNVISGIVAESSPDGSVTVTTQNGTSLTFPPPAGTAARNRQRRRVAPVAEQFGTAGRPAGGQWPAGRDTRSGRLGHRPDDRSGSGNGEHAPWLGAGTEHGFGRGILHRNHQPGRRGGDREHPQR